MGKMTKKRMGRPRLGNEKKTEIVRIRVTKAELGFLRTVAQRKGLTVPQLLMSPWRKES
jgi:hypothetical protein